ncbi:hypothetical protein DYB26_008250 [Aphanomyces astaci]|uniref:Glycosyl transferase family 1 domain-containing protein n=1 Tax=Aphanomyces astaci TaxID=112090 RepID=A0A418FJK3_APHAT|nr:hypothetical protein DYB26_008250 [Aphanomyces astaci]
MQLPAYRQDWKENPKPFYFRCTILKSSRCRKPLKVVLALMAAYVFMDGLVTLFMYATLTHGPVPLPHSLIEMEAAIASSPVRIEDAELLHLSYLNAVCTHEKDAVISWAYNSSVVDRSLLLTPDTPTPVLVQALSNCPDIDIFLPSSIRDHGYCEDSMAYVLYLRARALPEWVVDMTFHHAGKSFTYFDLCPRSAMLFMNHYWHNLPFRSDFPRHKKVVLMPNVEMYELKAEHYHRADYVLAKTLDAYSRLTRWYTQHQPPAHINNHRWFRRHVDNISRHTKVLYTQHTSSDPTILSRTTSPYSTKKTFQTLSFLHVNGRSVHKNTLAILDCWQSRPDLPPLVVYAKDDRSNAHYHALFPDGSNNVQYHHGTDVDPIAFGEILAAAPVILCPSAMEGYVEVLLLGRVVVTCLYRCRFGHYINQARAAGAVVVTTDGLPMREFVDKSNGVLVAAELLKPPVWTEDFWSLGQEMGRQYKVHQHWRVGTGMEWTVTGRAICDAVDKIVTMSPRERQAKAAAGRLRYLHQLTFFKKQMLAFLVELQDERALDGDRAVDTAYLMN